MACCQVKGTQEAKLQVAPSEETRVMTAAPSAKLRVQEEAQLEEQVQEAPSEAGRHRRVLQGPVRCHRVPHLENVGSGLAAVGESARWE